MANGKCVSASERSRKVVYVFARANREINSTGINHTFVIIFLVAVNVIFAEKNVLLDPFIEGDKRQGPMIQNT